MARPKKETTEEKEVKGFAETLYEKDGSTKYVYREEVAKLLESQGWKAK